MGGEGGTGGDPSQLCERDACIGNETLKQECVDEWNACSLLPDIQQDECRAVALATCST
jgi:hypothetical protein